MCQGVNRLYRTRRSGWFAVLVMALCLTAAALLAACGGSQDSTAAPGEDRDGSGEATAPGAPEPAPDGATASQSEHGPLGRPQEARQITRPLLYVDAELEAPTLTAEVDGSSILFTAEDAREYNRTVVELEGIGLWEAVTTEGEEYIDVFTVPAPTLETVRWRAASAIAPEDAGGRYRIGPWTDWTVLQVPQVVPPDAGVDRSELP